MIDRAHALAAGLFLIGMCALLGVVAWWLAEDTGGYEPYTLAATTSVDGLSEHSTVSYRGVGAGEVTGVEVDPKDRRRVLVHVSIDPAIKLTSSSYGLLSRSLVTGAASLVIDDSFDSDEALPPGSTLPLHPSMLQKLRERAPRLIDKLTSAIDNVARLFDRKTVDRLRTTASGMAGLAKQLPALGRDARGAIDSVDRAATSAGRTLASAERLVTRLGRTASALEQGVSQLGRDGSAAAGELLKSTLPKVNAAFDGLQQMARSVRGLSRSLRRNPQRLLSGPRPSVAGPGEPGYARRSAGERR